MDRVLTVEYLTETAPQPRTLSPEQRAANIERL